MSDRKVVPVHNSPNWVILDLKNNRRSTFFYWSKSLASLITNEHSKIWWNNNSLTLKQRIQYLRTGKYHPEWINP